MNKNQPMPKSNQPAAKSAAGNSNQADNKNSKPQPVLKASNRWTSEGGKS
jgi:hypothetical protein